MKFTEAEIKEFLQKKWVTSNCHLCEKNDWVLNLPVSSDLVQLVCANCGNTLLLSTQTIIENIKKEENKYAK